KCWGYDVYGGLVDGMATKSSMAVAVSGLSNAVAIATGDMHSCALVADGTVKCWGNNVYGQLGNGTTTNASTPVAVSGLTGVIAIAVTGNVAHSCALMANGIVKCWGGNS